MNRLTNWIIKWRRVRMQSPMRRDSKRFQELVR